KGDYTVNITIKPYLQQKDYLQPFLFVIIEELEKEVKSDELIPGPRVLMDTDIDALEKELKETRENLQAVIEEVESANEELQSNNEEMISANEELQSTNEELQSLNEELHTVSAEHQMKIKELLELNDDMNNYFLNSDIGQVLVDKRLVIRKFTPMATRFVNLIGNDVGRSIVDITNNIKDFDLVNDIKEVMKTNTRLEKEIMTGSNNFCLVHISPYVRIDKTVDGVVINFIDITQTKKLGSIIQGIFDSSASGIIAAKAVRDTSGSIMYFAYDIANKTALEMLRINPKDIKAKKEVAWFDETGDMFTAACIEVANTGATRRYERYLAKSDTWLDVAIAKMLDGLVITFTNVTDKKKAADVITKNYEDLKNASGKLVVTNAQLERSNMDLMQFASVASHDLKEPLRKIETFGNFMKARVVGKLDTQDIAYLDKIIGASGRMKILIEDVLTLSKLSDNELHRDVTDLNHLVSNIINDLEITIKEKKARVIIKDLPSIKAIPGQIRQLFQNLIANSLKFNDKQSPKIVIEAVEINKKIKNGFTLNPEEFIAISVKDNGLGFEEKYKDKIFGIFQRLHGRNYEGTGIGLAIAKRIVENHSGFIHTQSAPGKGACFTILFPKS
ncbi:MAG: chemotaxis protein, partial [Bacteroidota bacterium]|nr:chemotaxis protein [Bacteroidota bacterium]